MHNSIRENLLRNYSTFISLIICLFMTLPVFGQLDKFRTAKPIFPAGLDKEMNTFVGFRTVFGRPASDDAVIKIAGSSLYRIFLNGEFLAHGPARGPHGYYRVDTWKLPAEKLKAVNIIAIEVAGYNVNSYYLLDQPAFLQAEIIAGSKTIASTAGDGVTFEASILKHRTQKVQRYSFQRPFTEYYKLTPSSDLWKTQFDTPFKTTPCDTLPTKNLIPRRVANPNFNTIIPKAIVSGGTFAQNVKVDKLWKDRALVNIGPKLKGYTEDQLEVVPSIELQKRKTTSNIKDPKPYTISVFKLKKDNFKILDLGINLTGFIGLQITCKSSCRVYLTFDEILQNDDVNFKRMGCVNAIGLELAPGTYNFESLEPYTLQYLKIMAMEGDCAISGVYMRELTNPQTAHAEFDCSDPELVEIFNAAKQTFRQNATDIFMDCPSRERAGWLCDTFFTARVALDLTGNTTIEKNMYENYLLPEKFKHIPKGMLPMCYPADHNNGVFIPNWAMWFVVQLEEYLARSNDRELVDALEPRVMELLEYFKSFENESGLLEKLQSWIFIEWSQANNFVQDVNYPTNMLYAKMLDIVGRIYDKPKLIEKANALRKTILAQSYDGEFFIDNAVRKDGKLEITTNRTEVCQYFAFYFGIASEQTHSKLWSTLRDEFGPERKNTKAHPQLHMANAFIGNYLRLELLSRYGNNKQLKDELVGYFLYMARRTGTLWENTGDDASCNHGFASHVAHCIYRDILGVKIDQKNKTVHLTIRDTGLEYCSAKIPTLDGTVKIGWALNADSITVDTDIPAGYKLIKQNLINNDPL